jgi:hypothetical protein
MRQRSINGFALFVVAGILAFQAGPIRVPAQESKGSSMRKLIYALSVAFTLGGLAPITAAAGEGGCDYSGHVTKKNDLETPQPAAAATTTTTKKKQG